MGYYQGNNNYIIIIAAQVYWNNKQLISTLKTCIFAIIFIDKNE